jgi:5-methylcytosine-specific restriction endonuclease McrA
MTRARRRYTILELVSRGIPVPLSVTRQALRRAIVAAQEGICAGCCEPVSAETPLNKPLSASLDHVIPRRHGGHNLVGNLIVMHERCNSEVKGGRMPTGCELIWLLAVNARLGVGPQRW